MVPRDSPRLRVRRPNDSKTTGLGPPLAPHRAGRVTVAPSGHPCRSQAGDRCSSWGPRYPRRTGGTYYRPDGALADIFRPAAPAQPRRTWFGPFPRPHPPIAPRRISITPGFSPWPNDSGLWGLGRHRPGPTKPEEEPGSSPRGRGGDERFVNANGPRSEPPASRSAGSSGSGHAPRSFGCRDESS